MTSLVCIVIIPKYKAIINKFVGDTKAASPAWTKSHVGHPFWYIVTLPENAGTVVKKNRTIALSVCHRCE
jgi:hypothetical protein